MGQLLRLIAGYDKRAPTRTFTIANSSSTANVHLFSGGFAPAPGKQTTYWSGRSPRQHGQKRKGSTRDNARLSITYDLNGGSAAELRWLQSEITRFFEDVRRYEEEQISVPAWLEYRWQDGLDDIPAPVFGQFSYYIRILDGGPPEWPKTLHNTGVLTSGNIEQVMCELVCEPFWDGLPQLVGMDLGQAEMTPWGILQADSTTNLATNPSFGHATWDTGWGVSAAALHATQETRPGYTHSLNSAAHLYNTDTAARNFRLTLTLTATTYAISCYARRPDGAAVTSADFTLLGQDASQTTTFTRIQNTPWYRARATFTGVAAAAAHGIRVAAGREVIVDDVQIEASGYARPFCAGWQIGCIWVGTAHASNSQRVDSTLHYTGARELNGLFTAGGWMTFFWDTVGTVRDIFNYQISVTTDYLNVTYDPAPGRFEIAGERNNVAFSGNGATRTITFLDNVHLFLIQNETEIKLYVNGVLDITVTTPGVFQSAAGTFYIGGSLNNAPPDAAVDGWRIWDMVFTAAQGTQLYNNELEVKNSHGLIGTPPVFWNKDGDSILDQVDDSGRDNWGCLLGVVGDVEADVEWRIAIPTASPSLVHWLGRKATDAPFEAGLLWLEFQGTVDANSSGGEYEAQTSAAAMAFFETITTNTKVLRGRYQYLARMRATTNSVVGRPAYHFGSIAAESAFYGDEVTIATGASLLFRDFGDMTITFDDKRIPPKIVVPHLTFLPTTGSATIQADFLMLLSSPSCRVGSKDASLSISAGDLLVIHGEDAYVYRPSDGSHRHEFEHRGATVDVEPGKYNYIWFLMGQEDVGYTITTTATFTIYVTPRWLLPGGAVA